MSVATMRQVSARTIFGALLAFLVVAGATIGYLATRPAAYQARIVLVAAPNDSRNVATDNYPASVSLTMEGVVDAARSRSVLARAVVGVPNAPTLDVLAGRVSVEAVPGSGVARISVTGDTARQAEALTQAIGAGVMRLDLLRPVGTFRLIDTKAPEARKIAPDLKLGMGFGLAAGMVAAVLAAAALPILRPRLSTRQQVSRIVDDALIIELDAKDEIEHVAALLIQPGKLLLVPAGVAAEPVAAAWRRRLKVDDKVPDADDLVLVVVRSGMTTPMELRNAVSLVNASGRRQFAVVLARASQRAHPVPSARSRSTPP